MKSKYSNINTMFEVQQPSSLGLPSPTHPRQVGEAAAVTLDLGRSLASGLLLGGLCALCGNQARYSPVPLGHKTHLSSPPG